MDVFFQRLSIEFFEVSQYLMANRTSILLLLYDTNLNKSSFQTASERLAFLKGSSVKSKREKWHIRERIGGGDGLLAYIHSPDSKIDMIRELGILLDNNFYDFVVEGLNEANKVEKPFYKILKSIKKEQEQSKFYDLSYNHVMTRLEEASKKLLPKKKNEFCSRIKKGTASLEYLLVIDQEFNLGLSQWDIIVYTIYQLRRLFVEKAQSDSSAS